MLCLGLELRRLVLQRSEPAPGLGVRVPQLAESRSVCSIAASVSPILPFVSAFDAAACAASAASPSARAFDCAKPGPPADLAARVAELPALLLALLGRLPRPADDAELARQAAGLARHRPRVGLLRARLGGDLGRLLGDHLLLLLRLRERLLCLAGHGAAIVDALLGLRDRALGLWRPRTAPGRSCRGSGPRSPFTDGFGLER